MLYDSANLGRAELNCPKWFFGVNKGSGTSKLCEFKSISARGTRGHHWFGLQVKQSPRATWKVTFCDELASSRFSVSLLLYLWHYTSVGISTYMSRCLMVVCILVTNGWSQSWVKPTKMQIFKTPFELGSYSTVENQSGHQNRRPCLEDSMSLRDFWHRVSTRVSILFSCRNGLFYMCRCCLGHLEGFWFGSKVSGLECQMSKSPRLDPGSPTLKVTMTLGLESWKSWPDSRSQGPLETLGKFRATLDAIERV